ncbi:MAG TPA: CPBP family glutamic-type intramembrane protease [Deinococcales bacterium]|nr:CPBP family glutamic-type intramembrane protease [Deinococcales bacterium]
MAGSLLRLPFHVPDTVLLVLQGTVVFCSIAALSAAMERLPSYRSASGLLEDTMRRIGLTPGWALVLSLTSSLGEELFFRWLLLGVLGLWLPPLLALLAQAVAFALMHPAPRSAWAYPLWTLLAGLVFGGVALASGSPAAGILAHYLFNHLNFLEVTGRGDP